MYARWAAMPARGGRDGKNGTAEFRRWRFRSAPAERPERILRRAWYRLSSLVSSSACFKNASVEGTFSRGVHRQKDSGLQPLRASPAFPIRAIFYTLEQLRRNITL